MRYNVPDRVIKDITTMAEKWSLNKVILFGSRARGTHNERSDIDIAVSGGNFDSFYWDIKEKVHSLLLFDVINLDKKVSDDLIKDIEREGIVIYENAG